MSFNLVLDLAAKRVALGKSQTVACLDVSTAFLQAKMKDEVYIKLDADTLRMIHEENMTNLKPFDEGLQSPAWTQRLTTILEGRRGRGNRRSWTQTEQDRQFVVRGPKKPQSVRACGRRASLTG